MILPLILGISGIFAGIALSFIAPEELKKGWKYFRIFKWSMFIILAGLMIYFWWNMQNFLALGIFAVLAIILFIINLKFDYRWIEIVNYALFIIPYFLLPSSYQLLIASVLFIYGLPTGTLLWNMDYEKN